MQAKGQVHGNRYISGFNMSSSSQVHCLCATKAVDFLGIKGIFPSPYLLTSLPCRRNADSNLGRKCISPTR